MRASPRNQQPLKPHPESKSLVVKDSPETQILAIAENDDRPLEEIRQDLGVAAIRKLRGKRHDITTNKGAVQFLNDAMNAYILAPGDTEGCVTRQELNTVGYVVGITLKGIAAVQAEDKPQTTIMDLLGDGINVGIQMTKEERKIYLTAGSVDKMQQVLQAVKNDGRVVDMEAQSDGSYAASPMEKPPRMDAQMPTAAIAQVFKAEGYDIKEGEVLEIFGSSLGDEREKDISGQGFEAAFKVSPATEPALAHAWSQINIQNPDMPGAVIRRSQCTKCGITTNNTRNHEDEECVEFG